MKTKVIKLRNYEDITAFVHASNQVQGDVTVKRGKYIVDGKSFFGVFSLVMSEGASIEYPESAVEFEQFLSKYE